MARLIGTAGHVDHGKTTLIKALTGIDADRLPEEKKRGMTIDVGFAHMEIPGIGRVSVVDVPGHERFLTNMLVGALGVDVALLCVSADEAVMPQTREHLQILELLPVERLVVALTRADLADEEVRALARADVEEFLAQTRFPSAPILEVSAFTGEGLDALREELRTALQGPEGGKPGPWYLPVDRAFSVKGHGVVVTGTLARGTVRAGDRAYLEPGHLETRVRAIHTHGDAVESSEAGRRTALNLGGLRLEDVRRGMALGEPGAVFETRVLDARVRWVAEPKHGQRVRVSVGAEEVIGKAFLSEGDPEIVQLRLESPVAVALDQPLVVRRYSPPDLVCGGRVVVPQARVRRRGEVPRLVEAPDLEGAILEAVGPGADGTPTEEVCRMLGKTPQALGETFEALQRAGRLRGFAGLWFAPEGFEEGTRRFLEALRTRHEENPTQANVPRERIVQSAGLPWVGKPLDRILAALAEEGRLEVSGTSVKDPAFRVRLSPRQRDLLTRTVEILEREPVNTPPPHEIARALVVPPQAVDEILRLGVQAGEIVVVGEGVYYTPAQLEKIKARIREIAKGAPFPASAIRDALGTTRKYVIPLLEHLDAVRFTTRVGDNRMINER